MVEWTPFEREKKQQPYYIKKKGLDQKFHLRDTLKKEGRKKTGGRAGAGEKKRGTLDVRRGKTDSENAERSH